MPYLPTPDKNGYCCKCEDRADICTCTVCATYTKCPVAPGADDPDPPTYKVRMTSTLYNEVGFPYVIKSGSGRCYENPQMLEANGWCNGTYDTSYTGAADLLTCEAETCTKKYCIWTWVSTYDKNVDPYDASGWSEVTLSSKSCYLLPPITLNEWSNSGGDPCVWNQVTVTTSCENDSPDCDTEPTLAPNKPNKPTFEPPGCLRTARDYSYTGCPGTTTERRVITVRGFSDTVWADYITILVAANSCYVQDGPLYGNAPPPPGSSYDYLLSAVEVVADCTDSRCGGGKICRWEFDVSVNLSTGVWTTPYVFDVQCVDQPCLPVEWGFYSTDGEYCHLHKIMCATTCGTWDDCNAATPPSPGLPSAIPPECYGQVCFYVFNCTYNPNGPTPGWESVQPGAITCEASANSGYGWRQEGADPCFFQMKLKTATACSGDADCTISTPETPAKPGEEIAVPPEGCVTLSYSVRATLDVQAGDDLDLHGNDGGGECYYANMTAGGLTLDRDCNPGCSGSPIGLETISGSYTEAKSISFWAVVYDSCGGSGSGAETMSVTNNGAGTIYVNGAAVAPAGIWTSSSLGSISISATP